MAKPAVIIVGADKGGVGKTTVSRTLLDYFAARRVPVRAFDTETPRGTLKRFHPEITSIVDLNQVIGDVLSLLEHQFEKGSVKIRRELHGSPVHVVGFGAFARDRAEAVLAQLRAADPGRPLPTVHQVLHPSPASPAANRGWARQVDAQLERAGIAFGTAPILRACASPSSTSSGSRRASSRAANARSSRPSRNARAASGR